MSVSQKEKELAAVGISVATGCKPCTDHHMKAVREAGASDAEIGEAVAEAVTVRRAATEAMERYALARLGAARGRGDPGSLGGRVKELVAAGAAFGVNCVSTLEERLAAAETAGVSREDLVQILKLAAFIKGRAASHVDRRAEALAKGSEPEPGKAGGGCC